MAFITPHFGWQRLGESAEHIQGGRGGRRLCFVINAR